MPCVIPNMQHSQEFRAHSQGKPLNLGPLPPRKHPCQSQNQPSAHNQGLFISTKHGNYSLADVEHGPGRELPGKPLLSPVTSADPLPHSGQG